jgi:hypothetical protein
MANLPFHPNYGLANGSPEHARSEPVVFRRARREGRATARPRRSRTISRLAASGAVVTALGAVLAWTPAASAVSITTGNNSSQIAAEGPKDTLRYYWQTFGHVPWNPEKVAGNRTTYSAPSLTDGGGSSVIVAEGPGHSLRYYWQYFGHVPWNPEVVAGTGTTYGGPSLIINAVSSIVAAQSPRNSLRFYWQTIGHVPWNPEHVSGNRTTYA